MLKKLLMRIAGEGLAFMYGIDCWRRGRPLRYCPLCDCWWPRLYVLAGDRHYHFDCEEAKPVKWVSS